MKISGTWNTALELRREKGTTTYTTDLDSIANAAGVYVFCIKHGTTYDALYVGKAEKLRNRIKQQLNNNKLMNVLAKKRRGTRLLFVCEISTKQGQTHTKNIGIVEAALIEQFLWDGHSIVNDKGTKRPTHSISFTGTQASRKLVGSKDLEVQAR